MKKTWIALLLGLVFLLTGQSQVQAQGAQSELYLFEEIPMVTVATRTEQKLTDAPAAISVITAKNIEESGYLNIWDLLRTQPGVHVKEMSGTAISVAIRGFSGNHSSNKLAVNMDGRSIFNPLTQGVWWTEQPIMLDDIARIEIMRGPNSVLYGFNAFNGIINIVTKDPKDTQGALAKTSFGTQYSQQYFFRYGGATENFDYRISYQKDNSQGLGDDGGKETLDGIRTNAVNFRSRYALGDDKNIELLAGVETIHKGPYPKATANVQSLVNDFQTVRYNQTLSDDSNFTIQFARTKWNSNNNGDSANIATKLGPPPLGPDPATIMDSGADTVQDQYVQYDLEMQHSFSPLEGHNLVWGANYRRNQARMHLLYDPINVYHDTILRVFGQDAISLTDALTWYAGLDWEENQFTGSDWTTRQTLMYKADENHSFRASYARAVRAHSFIEYFFNIYVLIPPGGLPITYSSGNPNPQHESIQSYELGYRGTYLDKKLTVDAETFYYKIRNILVSVPTGVTGFFGTAYTFDNGTEASVSGLELSLDYKPREWLKTYANYTYLHLKDKAIFRFWAGGVPTTPFSQFDNLDPAHTLNLGTTFYLDPQPFLPDLIDVKLGYVSGTNDLNISGAAAAEKKVEGYFDLDMKLSKKFMDDAMEVSLLGLNLIDDDRAEYTNGAGVADVPDVVRQFFLTVKYVF